MLKALKTIVWCILCVHMAGAVYAQSVLSHHRLVTSHAVPYSIEKSTQQGVIVDIVAQIEKQIGSHQNVDFLPWPRAQLLTQKSDNHIIFPLARTQAREDKYTWLIDVMPLDFVFVSLDKPISSLEEAMALPCITVRAATPFEGFLKKKGFENVRASSQTPEEHLQFLSRQRAQAWFGSRQMIEYTILKSGFKGQYFVSEPVASKRIYIAGSANLSDDLKAQYVDAYQVLQRAGVIEEIMRHY